MRQAINVTTSPTGGITLATQKPKSPQSDFRYEKIILKLLKVYCDKAKIRSVTLEPVFK